MAKKKADKKPLKKSKEIKVFFCPRCKSTNVGFILGWKNIFGVLPRMKCKKCGLEERAFPIMVVDVDKLDKLDKKVQNKKILRRKKK